VSAPPLTTDRSALRAAGFDPADPAGAIAAVAARVSRWGRWGADDVIAMPLRCSTHEFFLTAAPLRITGPVGSPVNPIAVK
jgi:hypothetical protein